MTDQPIGIRVEELGHVALFVRDGEASARFYRDVLGLIDRGRGKEGRIAAFSAGRRHHDLACQAVPPGAPAPTPGAPGLDGHEIELYVDRNEAVPPPDPAPPDAGPAKPRRGARRPRARDGAAPEPRRPARGAGRKGR